MRRIKNRHSAWRVFVITLLIVVLALALAGCGNNKPRRVALDVDALPTLDRDALPYGQLIFHESAYPEHALDVLQAQRLETPVCLIVQEFHGHLVGIVSLQSGDEAVAAHRRDVYSLYLGHAHTASLLPQGACV